jgi:hypothetical protein
MSVVTGARRYLSLVSKKLIEGSRVSVGARNAELSGARIGAL